MTETARRGLLPPWSERRALPMGDGGPPSPMATTAHATAWLDPREHVVIIGGGFGGLSAARALRRVPVRVTLIDRHNYHLFQPLLYQVATAALSPADIAEPIRVVLRHQRNATVLLDEVTGVDPATRQVRTRIGLRQSYDWLILATG